MCFGSGHPETALRYEAVMSALRAPLLPKHSPTNWSATAMSTQHVPRPPPSFGLEIEFRISGERLPADLRAMAQRSLVLLIHVFASMNDLPTLGPAG